MSDIGINRAVDYNMGPANFENEVVDTLNVAAYANPPPPEGGSNTAKNSGTPPYENNEHFWTDIIQYRHRKAGKYVFLKDFHLTEWIPRSPGTYFLPESKSRREKVKERFYRPELREYVPEGKRELVLAGAGSLRLDYMLTYDKKYAIRGATSDGITHEGIPVAIREDEHENIIEKIKECGGCICDISGYLEVLHEPFRLKIEYNRRIPKFYLLVDKIDFRNYSEKNSLRTSIAITFPQITLSPYDSAWSFCTLNPASDEDLDAAVDWLYSYARRYSGRDDPQILGDFDVFHDHFPQNRVEFPVKEQSRGMTNMEKLDHYKTSAVQVVIDRRVQIYGNVTNSPLYTGNFKESVSTTYPGIGTVDPDEADEWFNRGVDLVRTGRLVEAINYYDKVLEREPNNANVWNNKGAALHDSGQYEEAVRSYDKALDIDPNHANALNNKRVTLSHLGK